MATINISEETIDGIVYIIEEYPSGAKVKYIKPNTEEIIVPEPEPEYISKSELDAAYSEGVNSIG